MDSMGTTSTLVSPEEYLNTNYEPDREYVDGVLVRRNLGTQRHSLLQSALSAFFSQFRRSHRIRVFTDCRLLVSLNPPRYRVPDIMVASIPYRRGKIVVDVPVLIVEIKSPKDTFDDTLNRCIDYESLKVRHIFVMDPDNRRAWRFCNNNLELIQSESINLDWPGYDLVFPVSQLFREIDED